MSAEKVEKAALELSDQQRRKLMLALARSFHPEAKNGPEAVPEAWHQTLIRRAAEVDEGKVALMSGEEVGAAIRKVLSRRRRP